MRSLMHLTVSILLLVSPAIAFAAEPPKVAEISYPKVTDDRLTIELVAQEPDIVTPTGLTIDERGRIWVLENQTHQRTKEYAGPTSDRIRIFEDFDPAGRARGI